MPQVCCGAVSWAAFGETFVTLLVIMDPVGNAPIFVSMTRNMDARECAGAANRAVLAAGALVIGFALVGQATFDYLNVELGSLSIAGGLLLLLVALEMLRGEDYPEDSELTDVALVPLATPLVAGPGTIATVIVLAERNPGGSGRLAVVLGVIAALIVVWICLRAAAGLAGFIPVSVVQFLTRVFGLLLAAIAVQLVIDGIKDVS
jgi:multiple antibiotic resistance protein